MSLKSTINELKNKVINDISNELGRIKLEILISSFEFSDRYR